MIQLTIDGKVADLPVDISLQYTKANMLFAFDDLECERTTEFALPATPRNNAIFELANNAVLNGEAMRNRFDAVVADGVITKKGYLYITEYDHQSKTYNAIFVSGDYLMLKKIAEMGNIGEYILTSNSDQCVYLDTQGTIYNASARNVPWGNYKYDNNTNPEAAAPQAPYKPSWGLKRILFYAQTAINLQQDANNKIDTTLPTEGQLARVIVNTPLLLQSRAFNMKVSTNDNTQPKYNPKVNYNTIENLTTDILRYIDTTEWQTNELWGYNIQYYQAKNDISITFPGSFSNDWFLVWIWGVYYGDSSIKWYGSYSITGKYNAVTKTYDKVINGSPLQGRTIELKAGDRFILVHKDSITPLNNAGRYSVNFTNTGHAIDCDFNVTLDSTKKEAEAGDIISLKDNLPELDFVSLLKMVEPLCGKSLTFKYNSTTHKWEFKFVDPSADDIIDISDKVVSLGTMSRTFADYAQNNRVKFDSDENIATRLEENYQINNINLEQDAELYTLPFSEGNYSSRCDGVLLYDTTEKNTIAMQTNDGTSVYMKRATMQRNLVLDQLCNASTTISVDVKMSIIEYDQLKDDTIIMLHGVMYVWTNIQWQDGIATIQLSKYNP